jgi:hypothetical protein
MIIGSAAVFAPRSFGKSQPSADTLGLGLGHPWVTQGPRKGHARATQGPRKGHPRVDFGFGLCFQQKLEKGRGGVSEIAMIAKDRRDRKGKTSPLINTDNTDRKQEITGSSPGLSCVSLLES